jgi:hypothetical protein
MYNFWQTTITESVALAPKATMADGRRRRQRAMKTNGQRQTLSSFPLLRYKQTDIDGQAAPPPQRLQPEPPPSGVMAASAAINQDIATLMGIYRPVTATARQYLRQSPERYNSNKSIWQTLTFTIT